MNSQVILFNFVITKYILSFYQIFSYQFSSTFLLSTQTHSFQPSIAKIIIVYVLLNLNIKVINLQIAYYHNHPKIEDFLFNLLKTTILQIYIKIFIYLLAFQQYLYKKVMNRSIQILIICCVVFSSLGIFPKPKFENLSDTQSLEIKKICNIRHLLHTDEQENVKVSQLFNKAGTSPRYYLNKVLKRENNNLACQNDIVLINQDLQDEDYIDIKIFNDDARVKYDQGYIIEISKQSPHITIKIKSYSGYVYALQTLTQLIDNGRIPLGIIQDGPLVPHRGIMIDSVRHFLKYETISKLIQSMPISKLNIVHWHLSDDQSFTLQLQSHPELAEASSYEQGQYYTIDQVKQLIALGKKNAVSIIPEIDSPAHVNSWGRSQKWKAQNITILCPKGQGYNMQLDLSKDTAYNLGKDVYRELNQIFADSPYIHLGGDQVFASCWDLRPDIKKYMLNHNISDYGQLQMYWRNQMKAALPKNRSVVFWRNDAQNIKFDANDIVHYWGSTADIFKILGNTTQRIILSPSDTCYINHGFGNIWFNSSAGSYIVWKQIYQNFNVFPEGINRNRILGAQITLWGQVSNDDTFQNNIWMRGSAFSARLWTQQIVPIKQLVKDIVYVQNQLIKIGVNPSPIVSQFCQKFTDKCNL